ncbi:autophagy-related protein 17-like, partial [Melanaphis sacchari]|uniref:autophagy-related protein 17-like n=1 Tax=Melanaphis sacchari TaxID=742174 RepID=UPI000DC15A04
MSYDDEFNEAVDESLDEQWWIREPRELQLEEELVEDRILFEPELNENVIEEHIDYAYDEKQIQLAIKRLDELRLELSDLRRRKTTVLNILTEHIEKGLCESDVPIRNGTKEEIEQYYEKLLMQFKKKKEEVIQQKHDLNEKMIKNTEYLEMKRIVSAELADHQYNLELKTAVGMIYDKTKEKLSQEDVEKFIESCKLQDTKLNKARLNYILQKQKCKKLKENINDLAPSTFSISEYQELSKKNKKLENSIEIMKNIKTQYLKDIKSELAKIPNIDKKLIDLKEEKETNETELKQIKHEWKQLVQAKANYHKYEKQIKKDRKSNCFIENPLLLNDYLESVEKEKTIKEFAADLSQKLFDIEELKNKLTRYLQ